MRAMIGSLALVLSACGTVVVEPCEMEDAGEQQLEDAGPGPLEPDAGEPAPARELTGAQACLFLRDSIDEHGNVCQPCPFETEAICDADKLLACLYLLELQGGDCVSDASILRSADCATACEIE